MGEKPSQAQKTRICVTAVSSYLTVGVGRTRYSRRINPHTAEKQVYPGDDGPLYEAGPHCTTEADNLVCYRESVYDALGVCLRASDPGSNR